MGGRRGYDILRRRRGPALAPGMTYHYIVRAVNGTIKGDWTASMSGTTKLAKPTLESMPLVATPVGESMIRLSWSEVMDAPELLPMNSASSQQ